jgi:hypothetical protein
MGAGDIPTEEYVDLKHEPSTVTHWGQFKLLLGEIEFLTPYLQIPDLTIVYAGSAPGHHLKALIELMPSTWVWKLYDARPCEVYGDELLEKVCGTSNVLYGNGVRPVTPDVVERTQEVQARIRVQEQVVANLPIESTPRTVMYKESNKLIALNNTIVIKRETNPNVHVYQKNIDKSTALDLNLEHVKRPQTASDPQLLLISDIRTPLNTISELSVNMDMDFQVTLVRELKPYQASLKFKLPYTDNFFPEVFYLAGRLHYQPFSPRISHETRLVVGPDYDDMVAYNTSEYAKRMYHFQTVLRTSLYNTHEPAAGSEHQHLTGNKVAIDHCYDCVCARKIASKFLGSSDGCLDLLEMLAAQVASVQIACKGGGMIDE